MTRVYAAADLEELMKLAAGEPVPLTALEAESEDEEHEFEAMLEAGERGPVVVTAEVSSPDAAILLENVEAFHIDTDGSGDLSWFARQELVHVIEIVNAQNSSS